MKKADVIFENEDLKKDNDILREENRRLKILLVKYKNQIQRDFSIKQDDIVWERVNSDNPIFDMTPEELKQFKI